MKGRVRALRVEIATHAHATEDEERVVKAVVNLAPNVLRRVRVGRVVLEGHYGNPITRITVHVSGSDVEEFLREFASRLGPNEKRMFRFLIRERYDASSGRLFLRVSKQDAFLGHVRFSDGDDVVRVVVVFRGSPSVDDVIKEFEELGLVA